MRYLLLLKLIEILMSIIIILLKLRLLELVLLVDHGLSEIKSEYV